MLNERFEQRVRFDEVDSLGIVWHGHYVKYLEDGREAWGRKYGLTYLGMYYGEGYAVPMVDLQMQFKKPLAYESCFVIETEYVPCDSAKLILKYTLYNEQNEIVLTAQSIQVFVSKDGNELQLSCPEFYREWKKKWAVLT